MILFIATLVVWFVAAGAFALSLCVSAARRDRRIQNIYRSNQCNENELANMPRC